MSKERLVIARGDIPGRHGWGRISRLAVLITLLLFSGLAVAGVTASISGTVKDASGAAIVGANVSAKNIETGIVQTRRTNGEGFYSFQALPLGHYDIEIQQSGFKVYRLTGLLLDVNSALVVDSTMQVGEVKEAVTVTSDALHVETATTQLGEVISNKQMTDVPLVTRSYTDLLALQPGVAPVTSGMTGGGAGSSTVAAGFAVPGVSGDLNAGNLSVNGMREAANGFLLNGAVVQEFGFSGTSVIPNLDSIAEFRILTNNFDAEYGNYSGGQINVITKSGSNQLHGNAFEFLRNTKLDARNYFDPPDQKGTWQQNQFGGTLGGPIKKSKLFFFGDYQGNRRIRGITNAARGLPTDAERNGNFAGLLSGTVNGAQWAQELSKRLGYTVIDGEPYFTSGCTTATCVFPNAQIPSRAFATPSQNLLKYIPSPNGTIGGLPAFLTSSLSDRLRDDKFSGRVDANTRFGLLSAYYFFDQFNQKSPYTASSSVPGFNASNQGRTQVVNLGADKTIGNSAVNEFRFSFVRMKDWIGQPSGGLGVTPSSLGFTTGANTLGIVPVNPALVGVPEIDLNSFNFGIPSRVVALTENTWQALDNFSKIMGTHTFKFGGSYHFTQMQENLNNVTNGQFQFYGDETGNDFADFLLGAPSFYIQGQAPPSNGRNRYAGVYGQDSWRARPNLTLNYGLRWEFSTPWSEKSNQIETLVPGLQSKVYPGAPTGWVFPGDPGIPSTLAPTRYNNFAPRIGLAWSPNSKQGFLSKLTGGPGQTSIRLGWGMFYTSFEGATNFNEIGDPPYGFYYVGTHPSFATPFVNRADGSSGGQRFPVVFPAGSGSAANPDNSINWAQFLPISSSPGFWYKNQLPYAENYEFSIQRQVSSATLLTLSYVGTQAHHLLSTLEANPGNPALCLSLSQPNQVAAGTQTCGPGSENSVFTRANGTVVNGTRSPFGINFGSNGYFMTIGKSAYNSFQANVRHTSGPLSMLLGYTYGKSLDNASGYGEQINYQNPNARALSAFDVTHNFIVSYNLRLPLQKLGGPKRLLQGWQLSGITRFSTGLPISLVEMDDRSLTGTAYTGPFPAPLDTPDFVGGSIKLNDPRSGKPYFDPSMFVAEPLGQLGNASRRFFHGPGINNWDMALAKDTSITERVKLQFRAEFFNLFNHAQFNNPDGNFGSAGNLCSTTSTTCFSTNSSTFGFVQSARDPRIGQLSLKLSF